MKFQISEQKLKLLIEEFMLIGQQHKIEPAELAIVLKLGSEWLMEQMGMVNISESKEGDA